MELWTSPTPNGWKISIMLEELIEAGVDLGEVSVRTINLNRGEQFADDFTARNLNQKIPVLKDGMCCHGCIGKRRTSGRYSVTS